VSSTGAHGANRLASNSLLEAVVYAARIAEDIAGRAIPQAARLPDALVTPRNTPVDPTAEKKLRAMMSSHVGVVRNGDQLTDAVRSFAALEREAGSVALRNMATAALLVAASAFARHESRGGHFRADHPTEIPALAERTMTTLAAARELVDSLSERAPRRVAQPMIA
jgi:L-aspartate oxidase